MSNQSILIVDDDEDTSANLADIFGELGYRVDVAHQGTSALELVRVHSYPLALLDYKLPCMNGVELFLRIKLHRPNTAAFMITGYAKPDTLDEAARAGIQHVLAKPLDISQLIPMVKDVIRPAASSSSLKQASS